MAGLPIKRGPGPLVEQTGEELGLRMRANAGSNVFPQNRFPDAIEAARKAATPAAPVADPKITEAAKQAGLRNRAAAAAAGSGRYQVFQQNQFKTLPGGMGGAQPAAAGAPATGAGATANAAGEVAEQGLRGRMASAAKTGGNWLSRAGNAVRSGVGSVAGVAIPVGGALSAWDHAADPKKAYEEAGALGIDPNRDSLLEHSAAHTWNSLVAEGRDALKAVGSLLPFGASDQPEAAKTAPVDQGVQAAGQGPAVIDAPVDLRRNRIVQTPVGATVTQPDGGFAEITSETPNLREKVGLRMGGTGRSEDGTVSAVPAYTREQAEKDIATSRELRAARIGITPEQLAIREGRAEGEDTRFATIGQSGGVGILDNRYEALRRAKLQSRVNDPHLSPKERALATEAMKTSYSANLDAMGQLSPEDRVALLKGGKGGRGGTGDLDFGDYLNLLKFQADQDWRAQDLGLRRGEALERRGERADKMSADHDKRFYEALDRASVDPTTGEIDHRKRAELSKRLAGLTPGTAEFEDALQQSAATDAGMRRWEAASSWLGDNAFSELLGYPGGARPPGPTTLGDMQKELYTLATTMDDTGKGKFMGREVDTTNMSPEVRKYLRQTREVIKRNEQDPSLRRE